LGKGKILIYDFGTTAVKTVLFDENIQILDVITTELSYDYPEDRYVEFDAETYWEIAVNTAKEIITQNQCQDSLEIISIASQAETVIPVDSKGNCLRKAMVWLDTRAVKENDDLKNSIDVHSFYHITGLNDMDPIWPINKIKWLKNNEPQLYSDTAKFLLLKDYVLFKLTGEFVTDPSICSFSGYFDIGKKEWSQRLLDIAELDANKLPRLEESEEIIGTLRPEVQKMFGLERPIQVMNGMLDQSGSAIGAGNIEEGYLTETTGTVLALASTIRNLDSLDLHDRVPIVCHGVADKYLALTFCQTAGILLKWFRDNFCEIEIQEAARSNKDVYDILTEKARPDSINKRLIILPHFGGATSPVVNPDASGVIFGLNLDTNKGDIVKGIMESVAFLLKENYTFLLNNGFHIDKVRSLGGGAKSPFWLQIKSDVLNREFETIESEESTSRGCAFLAGKQLGLYDDLGEICRKIKTKDCYRPDPRKVETYEQKYRLYLDLYSSLGEVFEKSSRY
jgi:xylulokinase